MLCYHIMQYTCFPLFNCDKQTLSLNCMWCLMHGLDPRCGRRTACSASLRSTVDQHGEKNCPCFASMCQQRPRSFESSVLHTQVGPCCSCLKDWPGRFDLNLTVWEAEMLDLFSVSGIVGQVYVQDICLHSAYGWTAKTAAYYATWKFGPGLLPRGIPPFLQPVCSLAEQKKKWLKCTISLLEASNLCRQKQRSLMQYCAFTFACYSVFLLPGNIEFFRYAVGVVPLPSPLFTEGLWRCWSRGLLYPSLSLAAPLHLIAPHWILAPYPVCLSAGGC